MDGTLIDTEPHWMRAETALVESYGGVWTAEDGLTLVGSGLWQSAAILQGRGVTLSADEIVDWLTDRVHSEVRSGVDWRPGARELLQELREAGIPTALVTSSLRTLAEGVVATFDFPAFDYIVAGDDVSINKPHPEAYLKAAALLGVDIAECVAIEDSIPGVTSAVASGAVTVGVPLHSPLSEANGYTIWPTLSGRTVADLAALLRSKDTV
ncbi:MAG: putative hydrolase [Glaciihabitans sp.]|nr:putative hydrolase [Glaciihabitans sp.]